jgi:hypothetical protein
MKRMIKTKNYYFSGDGITRKEGIVTIELECGHTVERTYAKEPHLYCFCKKCEFIFKGVKK